MVRKDYDKTDNFGEGGLMAVKPGSNPSLINLISQIVEKSVTVVNLQALADQIEALANRPIEMNINGKHFAASDSVNGLRSTFVSRGLAIE